MTIAAPMLCLLLGWADLPPAPKAQSRPQPARDARPGPAYVVMQVKSGLDLVVKTADGPVTVRLLGLETPEVDPKAGVNMLNQMKFLRNLVKVGDRVQLDAE